MTKLSEIGEFGLIKRFSHHFLDNLPPGVTGIGDDCSVIPINNKEALLVTTDMLIEDSHFLKNKISPFELGYKSLAVNLSDIAAMGGTPRAAFLSLGIPSSIDVEWLDEFFSGFKALAKKTNTLLLGGDTTKSSDRLVINVAVTGIAKLEKIKKRSTALPGDIICVTGITGDSGGGLLALLQNLSQDDDVKYLIQQHHLPEPHLNEGKWLAGQKAVHAMMDVSDGIESDIKRIMEASGVGAEIKLEKLPVSHQLKAVSNKNNWNFYEIAAGGGEDYCLLVTVDEKTYSSLNNEYNKAFSRDLTAIGLINQNKGELQIKLNDEIVKPVKHGFDHFQND